MASDRVERRLAAIVAADVAGYSRLVSADEEATLTGLRAHRAELIDPTIAEHGGRIANTAGDSVLVEFPSAVDAVRWALALQKGMADRNEGVLPQERIEFRIGTNVGDVVAEGDDLLGDGVNVAARIEGLAESGGICLSRTAGDQVRDRLDLALEDMGDVQVKNIARPLRVFRIVSDQVAGPGASAPSQHEGLDRPTIAVLPFQNLSGDPEQDFLADGMTEDIIGALSRVRSFVVISRSTVFTYKGQTVDAKTIAADLGVRYVFEGSVRSSGDRGRLAARLSDARADRQIWAERWDRTLVDVFDLQDELTALVVGALAPEIDKAEQARTQAKRPEDLSAWENYQRGMAHFYRLSAEGFAEAIPFFDQAIARDPGFAAAYAGRGSCFAWSVLLGFSTDRENDLAEATIAAERARKLDPEDVKIHFALCMITWVKRDLEDGYVELETALALNPSNADAHSALGIYLTSHGRGEEALAAHDAALRLSPRDPMMGPFLGRKGHTLLCLKRHDEALELYRRTMQHGKPWPIYAGLTATLGHLGRIDEASETLAELMRMQPDFSAKFLHRQLRFGDGDYFDHFVEGLRKAGLQE